MYKCQTPDGRTAFQDKPCAGDARQGVMKAPAPAPSGAGAVQGDPEGAYQRFHQAVLASFDPPGWFTHLPAARRQQFDKDVQASLKWVNAVQFMKDEMPRTYRITGKSGSGNTARLTATGEGRDMFGRPAGEQAGVIDLVNEGGSWKIDQVTWGKRRLQ